MWIALGNTSLLDCEAFTWSLGCTVSPSSWPASEAITSLAFMLLEVPEPVWNTSIGNSPSCSPAATASAACAIAAARSSVITPRLALACAAAPLIRPSAAISAGSIGTPEIGKFSTARWVCAWYRAAAGTRTSPIVSCSMR